jgi:hypothetical protein
VNVTDKHTSLLEHGCVKYRPKLASMKQYFIFLCVIDSEAK